MTNGQGFRTSATLLGRLSRIPFDQAAWDEFVDRYGRRIHSWCRRWGLPRHDVEEVTQNVLMILARRMRTFAYDRDLSFRAWLKTVTRRAVGEFLDSRKNGNLKNGAARVVGLLGSLEAREDLEQRLAKEFDLELLEEAALRVRLRVEPATWKAFDLLINRGWSGAQVARQLDMRIGNVFVAATRVRRRLRLEVELLERMGT